MFAHGDGGEGSIAPLKGGDYALVLFYRLGVAPWR
jgi:hypothetical protein